MATSLAQGESCSSDKPESSKDPSSPLLDDHDGECGPSPYPFCIFQDCRQHLPG